MRYFNYFWVVLLTITTTSCNNEGIGSEQNDTGFENPLIQTTMSELMEQFDDFGNLENSENPTGNMTIDFCFNFVFPINFELNNGTIIQTDSIDELVDILMVSTDEFYINDFIYPFDIEVFNSETNSIEIITIDNENSFEILIEACDFDDEEYACTEEFEPVCVEINGPENEIITIVYPNACWAELDGFDENDFLDDCDYDNDNSDGDDGDYDEDFWFETDCVEFVFPIAIQTPNGDIITADDPEALIQTIDEWYSSNPHSDEDLQFVYPITVQFETENGWSSVEVLSDAMLYEVIDQHCEEDDEDEEDENDEEDEEDDEDDEDEDEEDEEDENDEEEEEDCDSCTQEEDFVCVQYENPSNPNDIVVEVFLNPCYAFCAGFTEDDFIDCE